MPNPPEGSAPDAPGAEASHPTERERAIRASVAGAALGLFLRLVSRRRSA